LTDPLNSPEHGVHHNLVYDCLYRLNTWVCRLMYGIKAPSGSPLPPDGPALIVCNHTSMGDPMVLLATAGRPIRFVMAQEIFVKPHMRWAFQALQCIPIRRGKRDVKAVRAMLEGLSSNEVIGVFPEGGLVQYRADGGHPGISYLAMKTGAPIIPAAIVWEKPRPASIIKSLLFPCQASIRYGEPLRFPQDTHPQKVAMQCHTQQVMEAIEHLRKMLLKQSCEKN
jgi:1-acyl-sn-glycerol-3-phosphate acyltransferase